MLLCRGKGCKYSKVCSRYVLGTGMAQYPGCGDTWIDYCLHAKKFIRIGNVPEERDLMRNKPIMD
jgi:hypothetical protein